MRLAATSSMRRCGVPSPRVIVIVSQAPIEGLLHPSDVLDTVGADAPEKLCKTSR